MPVAFVSTTIRAWQLVSQAIKGRLRSKSLDRFLRAERFQEVKPGERYWKLIGRFLLPQKTA